MDASPAAAAMPDSSTELPPTLSRNLEALTVRQPDFANIVRAARLPAGAIKHAGRDGTTTWRVPAENGRFVWFGQSSMPTISARETVRGVVADGGNPILPGVLTGVEILVLLERLHPHQCLFVLEEDPVQVRQAIELYDYSDAIRAGRLVFLGARPDENLMHLIERYPGYLPPTRLIAVPQRTAAQIAEMKNKMETAGARVAAKQESAVRDSCRRLAQAILAPHQPAALAPHGEAEVPSSGTDSPCQGDWDAFGAKTSAVTPPQQAAGGTSIASGTSFSVAIISADPSSRTLDRGQCLARAAQSLGWHVTTCFPDAPERCHLAARVRTVEESAANAVILLNGGPAPLADLLPSEIPLGSWYLPEARIDAAHATSAGPGRIVFLAAASQVNPFRQAGVSDTALSHCPVGADDALRDISWDSRLRRAHQRRGGLRAAVIMDLPDPDPGAAGISLPSHVALWNALARVLREKFFARESRIFDRADVAPGARGDVADENIRLDAAAAKSFLDDSTASEHVVRNSLFELAQQQSGVRLHDENLRSRFIELARLRLEPRVIAVACAKALFSGRAIVTLRGANWPEEAAKRAASVAPLVYGPAWRELLADSDLIVVLRGSTADTQLLLDALCAGAAACVRGSREWFEREVPGLRDLFDFLDFFSDPGELAPIARKLASDRAAALRRAKEASQLVRRKHTMARRLESIVQTLA